MSKTLPNFKCISLRRRERSRTQLIPQNRTTHHNVDEWILLLMNGMFAPPTYASPQLLTPLINPLEPSRRFIPIQWFNPQIKHLEFTLINTSRPVGHRNKIMRWWHCTSTTPESHTKFRTFEVPIIRGTSLSISTDNHLGTKNKTMSLKSLMPIFRASW